MRNLVAILILFLVGLPALAGTIISVGTTDPGSVGALAVDSSDVLAVSWYQPTAQSSVRIWANFLDLFGGGTFAAYLMNGIGPQADPLANEFASATFSASFFGPSPVVLFEHLTLPGGFFYLVLGTTDANSVGGWAATTSPTVILAPGVLQGDVSGIQYFASGGDVDGAYLPRSNFSPDDGATYGQLMYDVAVPEPSASVLVFGAGVLLLLFRRRGTS
jgi:hypothetical protein